MLIRSLLLLFAVTFAAGEALANDPPREILGIKLGMSEESVRERLRKVGTQQKAKRVGSGGEQDVWVLPRHKKFDYVLVRFDSKEQLWLMTVVTRPSANVRYSDIADTKNAKQANDGRNYTLTWTTEAKGKRKGQLVIARGSDPNYLTSYSIVRAKS